MNTIAIQGIVNIIIVLVMIVITWWALQSFKFHLFVNKPDGPQAKALLIILTIVIGSIVGNFFIQYLEWASWLKYLFVIIP